ncbi:DHS-like NAD/FAD-binding domain-containing protein [Ustulina deusta]|nr:DHS-like NAD/FAD-binding domain-containing protein [Ustulina deusta]
MISREITHVGPDSEADLQKLAEVVAGSRRVIVITGAGISTSVGIPDFRSINKSRPAVKTRDLFHATALSHPSDGATLIKTCAQLFQTAKTSRPTETHQFIKNLKASGRLVRDYTQNIDCLEEAAGLNTDLRRGPGAWSVPSSEAIPGCLARGVECVQLHGSLCWLRCLSCRQRRSWDKEQGLLSEGKLPTCPACPRATARGRRLEPGLLRPDILLYGELDPRADSIAEIIEHDLSLDIDILLIFGTSLAIHGIRELTKNFAKLVHKNEGKVLLINRESPVKSDWNGVIDYWVGWDCDAWIASGALSGTRDHPIDLTEDK